MKKLIYPVAALALLVASAFTAIKSQDWKIAEGYSVKFNGGDPSGEFKGLKGTISFDPNDLKSSKFATSIDVATINTGNGMKNTHAMRKPRVARSWVHKLREAQLFDSSQSLKRASLNNLPQGAL